MDVERAKLKPEIRKIVTRALEYLPGLSKASGTLTFSLFFLHYDLIYGFSEAEKRDSLNICLMNYYLVYGISETNGEVRTILQVVNYYLDYGTFETKISTQASHRR